MVSFARFFPVPAFLDPPFVGIDISETSVKYLELTQDAQELRVKRFGEESIPSGIVGVGGQIQKPELLAKLLGKLALEKKITHAVLSLPEEPAFMVRFSLPYVAPAGLREAIELVLEEHVPLPPHDVLFDYEILREPANSKDTYDLVVAAIPRELVESYLEAARLAGITVLACEIEADAVARAVIGRSGEETSMLVDLGKMRTGIAITKGQRPLFTSTVALGGEVISKAIQKSLVVAPPEADRLKIEVGLSRAPEYADLFGALVPIVSALKDEVSKHYTYWHSHKEGEGSRIAKIILCGGQANLPGLAEYLSSDLGIPVELANPWMNVMSLDEKLPEIPYSTSLRYTTAIGLALRRFALHL